jgi:hypothetical protein
MHPHAVSAFSWCCASESERSAGLSVTGRRPRESLLAARRGESDMASAVQKIKLSLCVPEILSGLVERRIG